MSEEALKKANAKLDQQWIALVNELRTENAKLRVENIRLRHLLRLGETGQAPVLLRRALGVIRGMLSANPLRELEEIETALDGERGEKKEHAESFPEGEVAVPETVLALVREAPKDAARAHWSCSLGAGHVARDCDGRHTWG